MLHAVVQDVVGAGSHDVLPQGHESHMLQDPVTIEEQIESVLAKLQNYPTAVGPNTTIGRTILLIQQELRQKLQSLQAERRKPHDEKAAAELLASCLDEISSVVKCIAEHQHPGSVSDGVYVTTVSKEQNERWRYKVRRLQQLCDLRHAVHAQLVLRWWTVTLLQALQDFSEILPTCDGSSKGHLASPATVCRPLCHQTNHY